MRTLLNLPCPTCGKDTLHKEAACIHCGHVAMLPGDHRRTARIRKKKRFRALFHYAGSQEAARMKLYNERAADIEAEKVGRPESIWPDFDDHSKDVRTTALFGSAGPNR